MTYLYHHIFRCRQCRRLFSTRSRAVRYCSYDCRRQARNDHRKRLRQHARQGNPAPTTEITQW